MQNKGARIKLLIIESGITLLTVERKKAPEKTPITNGEANDKGYPIKDNPELKRTMQQAIAAVIEQQISSEAEKRVYIISDIELSMNSRTVSQ